MKKIYLTLVLAMAFCLSSFPQCELSLDCSLQQNGKGVVMVKHDFAPNHTFTAYSFDIALPEGVTLDEDANGKISLTLGECHQSSHKAVANYVKKENVYAFACVSLESEPLTSNTGVLMALPFEMAQPITDGTCFKVELRNARASDILGTSFKMDNAELEILFTDDVESAAQGMQAPLDVYGLGGVKYPKDILDRNNPKKKVYIVNGKKIVK